MFPEMLTSVLSGATPSQLRAWRTQELLVPEEHASRPPLYSFRDIIAARSMAYVRAHVSGQKLRKAMIILPEIGLSDHLSTYQVGTDGETIWVGPDEGSAVDVLRRQPSLFSFDEIRRSFRDFRGREVAPLETPAPHITVRDTRLGGWPTIEGTRVAYDLVAQLLADGSMSPTEVGEHFPGVSADAALSAAQFAERAGTWVA